MLILGLLIVVEIVCYSCQFVHRFGLRNEQKKTQHIQQYVCM